MGQRERLQETSVDAQMGLSDERKRMRLEGLRILARTIARHAVSDPGLSRDGSDEHGAGPTPLDGQVNDGGPPERTDDAA